MKVNVLGTKYKIVKLKYSEEPLFAERGIDGYCDRYQHLIAYCDLDTDSRWDKEPKRTKRECEKTILRHEITHAFLFESGLSESTHRIDHGWACDEEIVDWMAQQSPKIFKAFQEADCL